MALYNRKSDDVKFTKTLAVPMTEAAWAKFTAAAAAMGIPAAALARRLLAFDNIVTREE